jgi:lysophospholipase L1-like esterase
MKFVLGALVFFALISGFASAPRDESAHPQILNWTDIRTLGVEGLGWNDTKEFYDRLPGKAEKLVPAQVWGLSHDSAGIVVRFETDAPEIAARWSLNSSNLAMPEMSANGASGLDLYVKENNRWRWLGVGKATRLTNTCELIDKMILGEREYLLYLPLFNQRKFVELGVPTNCFIRKAGAWGDGVRKPMVFYATSILQGLGAERPGIVHSAILGRRLNWPTINLGFSGCGRMEPAMADLLAELAPAVYVLDCLPNMNAAQVSERVEPFVQKLRAAHPQTPIVLVEDRVYANAYLSSWRQAFHADNHAALRAAFERLQKGGVKNLYYLPADQLFGDDGEWTVDGSHPNALGFMRQADAFAAMLEPLLQTQIQKSTIIK